MDQISSPLFSSVYGKVTYCCYSAEFSIAFGELQLLLSHEQLREFARRINQLVRLKNPLHQLPFPYTLAVYPPNCYGECFRFDTDEIVDLQSLLNGALVMTDLYQFLESAQILLETDGIDPGL